MKLLALLLAAAAFAAPRTVGDVLRRFGPPADRRLSPYFEAARVEYPPRRLTLLALKEERRLEVWAETGGRPVLVRSYPIVRASGGPGPKLREGDGQVPEGRYRISLLNPNSSYHLSMKIDYPNAFDRRQGAREGRTRLGGDIFIHGRDVSIGCLAMGDAAIEELFVLASRVGVQNIDVLIVPHDLRQRPAPAAAGRAWVERLYADLAREAARYR
ncbi:MAG: L,D-transpeptidase family protein [Elusimicrobia bacterium]|nr:L,D-transpeptidase family protein [Elusimicrobiota bacterium]